MGSPRAVTEDGARGRSSPFGRRGRIDSRLPAPMTYTFPPSIQHHRRSERGSLALRVLEGALPEDLRGFVYVVAPTGRAGEDGGRSDFIPFLNGDGTVYRVGFGQGPRLDWALTKPPCHWAEEATKDDPRHVTRRFRDWGITRLSDDVTMGGRNLLNTALQAVRFGGSADDRLLVTYESGRPFEIDPETLEVISPVGKSSTYRPTMFAGQLFEVVATTSHPAFDPGKDARGAPGPGVLFVSNYVREMQSMMRRLMQLLGLRSSGSLPEVEAELRGALDGEVPEGLREVWPYLAPALRARQRRGGLELDRRTQVEPTSAQLLFWDGASEPSAVTLTDEAGAPLAIRDCTHQLAVTSSYVVLVDSAFKFGMSLVIPALDDVLPLPDWVIRRMRERIARVQPQEMRVHLVPRAELVAGGTVAVKTVVLDPASIVHYFADYDDQGGERLVLHAIDNAATDSAEFLVRSDRARFPEAGRPIAPHVRGMMACGVDVDRMVRFEIDARRGTVRRTEHPPDRERFWSVALATAPGTFTAEAPGATDHVWFYTVGFLPEMISEHVWDLYTKSPDYARRIVSVPEVERIAKRGGIAPQLCCFSMVRGRVESAFAMPEGWVANSPQYVPIAGKTAPEGYLFSAVFGPRPMDKQIWIFEATRLEKGPIAKLGADEPLPWGYTLHTTWIERAVRRPEDGYRVPVKDDLPRTLADAERALVEEHVVPKAYGR